MLDPPGQGIKRSLGPRQLRLGGRETFALSRRFIVVAVFGTFAVGIGLGIGIGALVKGDSEVDVALKQAPEPRPELKVRVHGYTTAKPNRPVELPSAGPTPESKSGAKPEPKPEPKSKAKPGPGPAVATLPAAKPAKSDIPADAPLEPPKMAPRGKLQLAALPTGELPHWLKYAVAPPVVGDKPMIAIVIDDVGIDQDRTRRAIALPPPLTMAFIPYGYNLKELTKSAHDVGHELIVHMSMQPNDPGANPGPNALLVTLSQDELKRRLVWALGRFPGYVGLSNHMGSKFTAWSKGMGLVLAELKARDLLFLDSLTAGGSVGYRLSRKMGLPFAVRDVFLDNDVAEGAIRNQLFELESVARRRGYAIGIGHPYDATIQVLAKWLPEMRKKGFAIVPLTTVVRMRRQAEG